MRSGIWSPSHNSEGVTWNKGKERYSEMSGVVYFNAYFFSKMEYVEGTTLFAVHFKKYMNGSARLST